MFKFLARFASRPIDSKAQALRALACGDYARAEAQFTLILDTPGLTRHERAFLLNKRGVARVGCGHPNPAADFEAALQTVPRFAPALTNLGNLLLEAGRPAEAMHQYESAIAADSEYAVAYLNLGVALRRLGRRNESVRALRKAQRLASRITFGWRFRQR